MSDLERRGGVRQSNIELFRCIVMLLIIAHHYVVNSGLLNQDGPIYTNIFSKRSLFLLEFGAWGKTGINCFLLITGYYMCESRISFSKFIKLYGEILFYQLAVWLIFIAAGRDSFTCIGLLKAVLPFYSIGINFTGCFMAFWLCIPFLNLFIHHMTEKQHMLFTLHLLVIYTVLSTLSGFIEGFSVSMNYVSWYMVIYMIASFIRRYPKRIYTNRRLWAAMLFASLAVSMGSVLFGTWMSIKYDMLSPYYFLSDSNKILAVVCSICGFMFFINIDIPYSKIINRFGAATFGVFLIHTRTDQMRQWLWQDLLRNVDAYGLGIRLPIHSIGSVVGIFLVCSMIDWLRMQWIEKPFLQYTLLLRKKIKIQAEK